MHYFSVYAHRYLRIAIAVTVYDESCDGLMKARTLRSE